MLTVLLEYIDFQLIAVAIIIKQNVWEWLPILDLIAIILCLSLANYVSINFASVSYAWYLAIYFCFKFLLAF